MNKPAFPNYTQLEARLPKLFWWILRGLTLALTLLVIFLLFTDPATGLVVFWKLLIPLLPLSFAVAPGVWRNICPMALLNQLPRTLGFSRENTLSDLFRKLALYLSVMLFVLFVILRQPLFNHSGLALGLVLCIALLLSLAGGIYFKGRSGWCGTFCPLAPVQKAYGHAPLLMVKNGYCEPCLGCQKNCYDFNPRAAIFSDLDDADHWWSEQRKFFIALLPGLIAGFFNSSFTAETGFVSYLVSMLTPPVISIGVFYSLHNLLHVNFFRLASLFSMTALGIFYWYGIPVMASGLHQLSGLTLSNVVISLLQSVCVVLCLAVVLRGLLAEYQFRLEQQNARQASLGSGVEALKAALNNTRSMVQVVEQASGKHLLMNSGQSLLDALEEAELPIMSGCRMGLCGSDPVVITEGMESLDPPDENELNTLRRLGLEGKARLACCCKPKAGIQIDLAADPAQIRLEHEVASEFLDTVVDDSLHVVIIGNGIAGISTAETLREKDSSCRITLITQEPYHFYNRMGLEKVIYGRTAMQGLYLMKEDWYQRNQIDCWLNTRVDAIDAKNRRLQLATGEFIGYDKLVLASGAQAFVPDQPGFNLPAVFTLRDAQDALAIRSWVQNHHCRRVIVSGGGVLGVEAVSAMLELGLRVSLVHSDEHLMNNQLDRNAAIILRKFLENKGVRIYTSNAIDRIEDCGELYRLILKDNTLLVTDMVLLCIGARADVALAKTAGLNINRGVLVDEQMKSSDENIFCVGDAAELPGAVSGLWSIGNEQGKVAADVIAGGEARYRASALPPVQLKMTGIDLKSFGSLRVDEQTTAYSLGSIASNCWRSMLVKGHRLQGGVFVNSPLAASAAIKLAKKTHRDVWEQDILEVLHMDEAVN